MIDFIAYSLCLSIVRLRIHAMPLMIFNDEPALVYLRSAFPSSTTTTAYIIIHIGQETEADFFVHVSTKESSQLNRVYLSITGVTFFLCDESEWNTGAVLEPLVRDETKTRSSLFVPVGSIISETPVNSRNMSLLTNLEAL